MKILSAFRILTVLCMVLALCWTFNASAPDESPVTVAQAVNASAPDENAPIIALAVSSPFMLIGLGMLGLPNWKPLAIGVAGTLATLYVISRLLPGAAARVGLLPHPISAMQISWPEPFGLKRLSSFLSNSGAKAQTVSTGGSWDNVY